MTAHFVNRSTAEATLARQFAEQERREPSPFRAAAFARFAAAGLPTRRIEAWHYTDLRAAMTDAAPLLPAPDAGRDRGGAQPARRTRALRGEPQLVLLGGRFIAELSDRLPAGVAIAEGAVVDDGVDDPLAALNEAMSPAGCTISVARGADIAEPITILHLARSSRPALSIRGRRSLLTPARRRHSSRSSMAPAGRAAPRRDDHDACRGTRKPSTSPWSGTRPGCMLKARFANWRKRRLNAFGLVSGGALTRRQIFVKMTGDEAKVVARRTGAYRRLPARRHDVAGRSLRAGGTSREFYRAIVDDDAIGVFQGKIIVESAAQKTDGAMKSQAILLSPRAQMNEKPELEIFADDVVCGHGATVGFARPGADFLFAVARHSGGRSAGDVVGGVRRGINRPRR